MILLIIKLPVSVFLIILTLIWSHFLKVYLFSLQVSMVKIQVHVRMELDLFINTNCIYTYNISHWITFHSIVSFQPRPYIKRGIPYRVCESLSCLGSLRIWCPYHGKERLVENPAAILFWNNAIEHKKNLKENQFARTLQRYGPKRELKLKADSSMNGMASIYCISISMYMYSAFKTFNSHWIFLANNFCYRSQNGCDAHTTELIWRELL